MINVEYNQNRPTVSLVGKITDELALELIDEIRRLTNEQFFTEILLDIASPGGMDSALAHCVRALGEFRGSGLRIVTRVRSHAASAAAVLLSLGDRRIAAPGAWLQYHEGRVVGIDEVTGATATRIARGLANADAGIAALLAERARRDCGTGDGGNGRVRVRDFAGNDWDVVRRLVGRPGRKGKAESRSRLLKRLRRKVAVALAAAKPVKLARFYMDLFALDAPISPALARNLHLIDAVSSGEDKSLAAAGACGPGALRVPEWRALFRSEGCVARDLLCRHALILGETGSGKTASGILPIVAAVLDESSPVGCALVIDPKREVGPVVRDLADNGTDVIEIDVHREDVRPILDLMAGPLSIDGDIEAGRVLTAARKILMRASSLSGNNPAKVLAGEASQAREPYWELEGTRFAQTVLALMLILYAKAKKIFGTHRERGALSGAPAKVRAVFGTLGERAGIATPHDEIEAVAERTRERLDSDAAPEVLRTDFARDVRSTEFYVTCDAFEDDFEALKAECPEPRGANEYTEATRQLIESTRRASIRARPRWSADLGPNVLALAHEMLQAAFGLDRAVAEEKSDRLETRRYEPQFVAAAAVACLRPIAEGGEIDETLDMIDSYWNAMASTSSKGQYIGAFGYGRVCFVDFADAVPAESLYFGCEPGLRGGPYDRKRDFVLIDFPRHINGDRKTVYLFRPDLGGGREVLVARALKAAFFEAILNSPDRQENGASMPLVAYIADEAHRFVTSDVVHGEQSFLDTCRSFGAFCVLACQSVASLRHALAEGGGNPVKNHNAIEILLTNTANKLVFRSTDPGVREYLERLCPTAPKRTPLMDVQPPSTLRPGECYAILADGRFERRQLDQYLPPETNARETAAEPDAPAPESGSDALRGSP